jgi:hypothetical protein
MALLDAVLSGTSPFKESARQLAVSVGLATTGNRILGPYSDIAAHVADALYEAVLPGSRSGTLHWPLLLLTLVIAVALFVMRAGRGARDAEGRERERGLGEYLFPRDIYTHRIFAFLFALNGNFRHYHVSFRYPRWLERWLQSPGMHHVHHGYLPQHRDKNLGLVTSVWDRLVGTLYIGERYEQTPWGLGPGKIPRKVGF